MQEIMRQTLKSANQAFEAGARAARDENARKLRIAIKALETIANINNGPDRASGEYRCIEAAQYAGAALDAIRRGQP